jgi:hypothetical protein
MTGSPLWLTIALGLVPIVTALLAGLFAFTHPLGKRIDGFKTLIELRAKIPKAVNPSGPLDKIIMSEMLMIERRTDPVIRRCRRDLIFLLVVNVIPYILFVFATRALQEDRSVVMHGLTWIVSTGIFLAFIAISSLIIGRLISISDRSNQIGRKYADAVEPGPDGKSPEDLRY